MESRKQERSFTQDTSLRENTQMFKALGDETRLRMLGLLAHGELCVCDIMEVLQLPQSTASRHLAYLKNSKWIYGTRHLIPRGKWMYYQFDNSITDDSVHNHILQYLAGLEEVNPTTQHIKT